MGSVDSRLNEVGVGLSMFGMQRKVKNLNSIKIMIVDVDEPGSVEDLSTYVSELKASPKNAPEEGEDMAIRNSEQCSRRGRLKTFESFESPLCNEDSFKPLQKVSFDRLQTKQKLRRTNLKQTKFVDPSARRNRSKSRRESFSGSLTDLSFLSKSNGNGNENLDRGTFSTCNPLMLDEEIPYDSTMQCYCGQNMCPFCN